MVENVIWITFIFIKRGLLKNINIQFQILSCKLLLNIFETSEAVSEGTYQENHYLIIRCLFFSIQKKRPDLPGDERCTI
jgi:hypothetical protein